MWYKAGEKHPDFILGSCLVWTGSRIEWAFLNSEGKFCGSNSFLRDVTHWMPLPAPPTAADSGAVAYSNQQGQ